MEKLTAVQKAEREELVRGYQNERREGYDKQSEKVPEKVKDFIANSYSKGKGSNSELYKVLEEGLKSGKYKKPSEDFSLDGFLCTCLGCHASMSFAE